MQLHSERTTAPSPVPAPPHLKCPQSTLRFQLSPAPTLWQSPAQGQGCPGPREMLRRKRNKHEGDKEGQALQPSQLGTARAALFQTQPLLGGYAQKSPSGAETSSRGQRARHRHRGHSAKSTVPRPSLPLRPCKPLPDKTTWGWAQPSFQDTARVAWERLVRAEHLQRHPHRGGASTHLSRHLPGRHECWTNPAASAPVPPSFPTSCDRALESPAGSDTRGRGEKQGRWLERGATAAPGASARRKAGPARHPPGSVWLCWAPVRQSLTSSTALGTLHARAPCRPSQAGHVRNGMSPPSVQTHGARSTRAPHGPPWWSSG